MGVPLIFVRSNRSGCALRESGRSISEIEVLLTGGIIATSRITHCRVSMSVGPHGLGEILSDPFRQEGALPVLEAKIAIDLQRGQILADDLQMKSPDIQ